MLRLLLAKMAVIVVLALPLSAIAQLRYAPTDTEVAALPAFCAIKFKRPGPSYETQFGRANWIHMHHYCHGLKFVNRAQSDPTHRNYYLTRAKGEYAYVFRATEPRFWFRPNMYVEMARIHLQLGETADAERRFADAIAFNRTFEPAYIGLIEMHRARGNRSSALETATTGLRHLPESERLQKAYLDNGGKKPFPEPTVQATRSAQGTSSAGAAEVRAESAVSQDEPRDSEPENPDQSANRGCRFCPPDEIQQRWRDSFQSGQ